MLKIIFLRYKYRLDERFRRRIEKFLSPSVSFFLNDHIQESTSSIGSAESEQ